MSEEDETKETRGGEAGRREERKGTPRARKAVINGNPCAVLLFHYRKEMNKEFLNLLGAMKSKIKRTEKR